ncbi:MAG: 50S ribosomal protein L13 [Candidatus Shapirobacteria bacterium GW2011_GWE1_38_10]|uniref:Large ribosomal subunit protein uL13 n=1 Tax=Candidatus Shapirobacteria bacterium GW2011_GWE1_38_10 TaxID=1618488 RepID=A0A0G0LC15_9BACT|nr:MAG: 50S ribosomal protein L13 [Candidatus Shapirobacteria bacterium GW2011_GWF2_37_20]KKQ50166.1 MAG: 50S ribosomal protein L13 [Candidatus Shapirobacteria bacterium GW2011_GWE1_38_10]KKQ64760.1 MAG: 50S ribosomal protein L13 [Candidatus Shapirobacteria bacterium GW2011_GWF1_38_23]HBP50918.1 50S ribosomal protein L13 [Candidatus Shapirobacteria bacterium]
MKTKTTVLKGSNPVRSWVLIDLSGKTLGRAATEIAAILMGKNKVTFSYHRDDGDYVVAINAKDIVVTGKKLKQKIYYHHTGYAGHLKEMSLKELMVKDPRKVIEFAVHGMIPKNHLRSLRMRRLKIYANAEHKYTDKIGK